MEKGLESSLQVECCNRNHCDDPDPRDDKLAPQNVAVEKPYYSQDL